MEAFVSSEVTLVVLLFLHSGRETEFEQFESGASEIMEHHGGRIQRRISCPPLGDPSQPDEVHLVTFPDRHAFDRYRRDPRLQALGDLRATAIRETIVWSGSDRPVWQPRNRERED